MNRGGDGERDQSPAWRPCCDTRRSSSTKDKVLVREGLGLQAAWVLFKTQVTSDLVWVGGAIGTPQSTRQVLKATGSRNPPKKTQQKKPNPTKPLREVVLGGLGGRVLEWFGWVNVWSGFGARGKQKADAKARFAKLFCHRHIPNAPADRILFPIREGGMGLPSTQPAAEVAFVGSWVSALPNSLGHDRHPPPGAPDPRGQPVWRHSGPEGLHDAYPGMA